MYSQRVLAGNIHPSAPLSTKNTYNLTLFLSCMRINPVRNEVFNQPGVKNENPISINHILHCIVNSLCS